LVRGITRLHLIGLLINTTVGAGILGLPSKAYALVGSFSLFTWLLCATVVLGIALCLAEVSTRFRESGGPYLIAHTAFGPTVGFATGWLRLFTSVLAYATVCNLLLGYLALVLPEVGGPRGRAIAITAITGALAFVLVRGVRQTAWVSTAISAGKMLLLVGFVVLAAFHFQPSRVTWTPVPAASDFAAASLLSIFAFFGFEAGSISGGELADPDRDQPIAIFTSVGVTTLLYVLLQFACIGTLGSLATSTRPVADAAIAMVGDGGGVVITAGAVVLLLGVLVSLMLGASRTLLAMGERAQLPRTVARIHSRYRTPVAAIGVACLAAWAATLASTFTTAITIAVGTRVLSYIVVCAALPTLRRRGDVAPARFRLPAGDLIAALSILASIALIAAARVSELVALAALVVIGLVAQRVLRPVPDPGEPG
jgi:amino acid transporter